MKKFFRIVASAILGIFLCPLIVQANVSVVRDGSDIVVNVDGTRYVIHDNSPTDVNIDNPNGIQFHNKAAVSKATPGKIEVLPCSQERLNVKVYCDDEETKDEINCGLATLALISCKQDDIFYP